MSDVAKRVFGAVASILICGVVLGACGGNGNPRLLATPTPTQLLPTPTPDLAASSPKILAVWFAPFEAGPCEGVCRTLNFSATGPVYIAISCEGYQQFSGSLPTVDFQLFDANGHQSDAFHHQCGDPNVDKIVNFVIPERLPAGAYQLVMQDFPWQCTVTILDATTRG